MNLLTITVLPDPNTYLAQCWPSSASPWGQASCALPNNVPLGVRFCKLRARADGVLYNLPTGKNTKLDLSTTRTTFFKLTVAELWSVFTLIFC